MPDPRSVMKEFRSLDEKRRAGGLTAEEERRHAALRDLIGPEMGAGGLRPGFDVNAAAARLRDSLIPAGLRNRPPPPPEPAPEPVLPDPVAEASPAEALASAFDTEPFAPLDPEQGADALFDPSSLGVEPGPEVDPSAQAAWDPNQPVDPSAQPAWDPNQPIDPSAQAAWDPNQPYDPNAQPAWDPNQAIDPSAQAAWDPDQAGAADAGSPQQAEEPGEGELSPEGSVERGGPAPDAAELPPAGWSAEPPTAAASGPVATGEYDADVPWTPPSDHDALEARLPFDPAAASAIGPSDLPGAGAEGEYDDARELLGPSSYPPDLPPDASGFQATRGAPLEVRGWQEGGALDGEFQLESGGSFDAAASAVAPEWAVAEAPAPWAEEAIPEAGAAMQEGPPGDALAEPQGWDAGEPPPLDALPAEPIPEEAAGEAPPEAGAWATEEGAGEIDPAFEPGAPGADTWSASAADEPDLSAQQEPEVVADARVVSDGDWAEPELVADLAEPVEESDGAASGPAPALDFSRPNFSSEEDAFPEPAAPPFSEAPSPTVPEAAPEPELPPLDLGTVAPAAADAQPSPAGEEEIPTIEGEEILEEIPAEELAPPAPPAAEYRIPGSHRVVVHTVEGHVRRGVLTDADLAAPTLALAPQPDAPPESFPSDQVKAIFFMLGPGEKAPAPEGKKVRVTFRDGRQVAGFGPDYREDGPGFFMIPGDTRTNTGRIWVYRSAVRQVVLS